MSGKRILYTHHNNDDLGGADYCLFKMVREIQLAGYECFVLLSECSPIVDLYKEIGVPVIIRNTRRIEHRSLTLLFYPLQLVREIIGIVALIDKLNIQLVHTNDLFDFSGNIAAKLAKKPSCQSIRAILDQNRFYNKWISRLCSTFSDRILCVSNAVKEIMFPKCEKKCVVAYDWVDFHAVKHDQKGRSLREELKLSTEDRLIGCVGRIIPAKGQHVLLQAAVEVARLYPDVHFALIGNPLPRSSYYRELVRFREESPVAQNIHLLPFRSDIAQVMEQLDLLVNPSVTPDPFPGVVLEAMSCGTPVVGANGGGIPEQIIDTVNGFLFTPGDPTDLSDKIIMALKCIEDNPDWGEKARAFVADNFETKKIASVIVDIYEALVESPDTT